MIFDPFCDCLQGSLQIILFRLWQKGERQLVVHRTLGFADESVQFAVVFAIDLDHRVEGLTVGEVSPFQPRDLVRDPHPVSEQVNTRLTIERGQEQADMSHPTTCRYELPVVFSKCLEY